MRKIEGYIVEPHSANSQKNVSYADGTRFLSEAQGLEYNQISRGIMSKIKSPRDRMEEEFQFYDRDQSFKNQHSRFKPWHLVQGVENLKIERQTQENRPTAEKNIQQSNSLINDLDEQMGSAFKHSQVHKYGTPTGSKRQAIIISNAMQRKIKPKEKGLRKLSSRAFQIVQELKEATYKQVAIKLIQQMEEDQAELGEEKQENNIKRRVYDALNVLIAMGILQKKGRNIAYDPDSEMARQQNVYLDFMERKAQAITDLRKRVDDLTLKRESFKQAKDKIMIVKRLINRNQLQGKQLPKQSIPFPFVCLEVSSASINNLKLSKSRSEFQLQTYNQYSFFGDVDFLTKRPSKLA